MKILAQFYTRLTRFDPETSGPCPEELKKATFTPFGREIDAGKEVIVSVGAYGCLSSAFTALVHPGDEVIIIEPAFDC